MYKDSASITRMSIRGRMHETSHEGQSGQLKDPTELRSKEWCCVEQMKDMP